MRIIRHWWPNSQERASYSISIAIHWYGFTIILSWNKGLGVFCPVFFETVPPYIQRRAARNRWAERNAKNSSPEDVYLWEFDND